MAKQKKFKPLIGEELLTKVKELENLSKEEKAKEISHFLIKMLHITADNHKIIIYFFL